MSAEPATRTSRLSAPERRALVVAAATRAFARQGYAATTTDAVAREAGVSQPYVVRIFGSKRDLFAEVLLGAAARIRDAFERELGREPVDLAVEADRERLGQVYAELIGDRDVMLVLMHGFTASDDPEIGALARHTMGEIFALLQERTGASDDLVRDFVAQGMLLNVLLAIGATEHVGEHPGLDALSRCAFPPSAP